MEYKKLLVNEWFKSFEIMSVSKECFDNSPNIENIGSITGLKIKDNENLIFRVKELLNKGFKQEVL
jgi:hypothetical protein